MNPAYATLNVSALAARWWMPVLRGAAAILFGILAIVAPGPSLLALIFLWGVYAVVDGAINLMFATRSARAGRSWGWLLFASLVSIGAGLVAFAWPGMTAVVLLMVIAVWAVLIGVAQIAAAIRLRRHLSGEWLLGASGALSVALGALLFASPGAGALALVWLIGVYAIAFGALLIGLGLRLRRWGQSFVRPIPTPVGETRRERAKRRGETRPQP